MCRRCGEPDRRGSTRDRRARRVWLASPGALWGGDGYRVPCWNFDRCRQVVTLEREPGKPLMEVDRITPAWCCMKLNCGLPRCWHTPADGHAFEPSTYRRDNVRPSCGPCNRGRNRGNPWALGEETRCLTG